MPTTTRDPGPAASHAPEGAAEEPEPPSRRSDHDTPGAARLAPALATAWLPGADLLPAVELTISPVEAGLALLAAAIGGFGAIAGASLIGYSPTRLAQFLEEQRRPDKLARTAELDARNTEYFVIAAVYAAAGWALGLWALTNAFDEVGRPWAFAGWLGLMLFVTGGLPAAIADTRAERTVLTVLPLLRTGWYVLRWPLVKPLKGLTLLAASILRLERTTNDDPAEVQKQVMAAVADNVTDDSLADAERTWIGNIVTLKDLNVSTVMTPRPDIVAMPESISLREAVDQALEHEFSRYPVYRERIDEVVGIFYAKDALRLLRSDPKQLEETPLRTMLREPLFVPETTGAAQLLRRLQSGNQHMAIVIDEYGTTVGLATIEDLVEEIVGEIGDEYDAPAAEGHGDEQVRIVEAGRVLEIPARTPVSDVNRMLGTRLSENGDWETIAGLVIAARNCIPTIGETFVVDDVEFHVMDADERRLQRLRLTSLTPQPTPEGAK